MRCIILMSSPDRVIQVSFGRQGLCVAEFDRTGEAVPQANRVLVGYATRQATLEASEMASRTAIRALGRGHASQVTVGGEHGDQKRAE
jgi:hypothetical protein